MVAAGPVLGALLPNYQSGLAPMFWLIPGTLALVLALSLPSLRRLSSKSELQNAARHLRAILLQSRLTAIESGSVTYFRYQPGAGSFEAGGGAKRQALSADEIKAQEIPHRLKRS